ncbi:MAG TPA: hypothetical protein VFL42_01480, partial [Terriglobales bacterium]|nr:hypothetical protein [Terriglobales bacterium]
MLRSGPFLPMLLFARVKFRRAVAIVCLLAAGSALAGAQVQEYEHKVLDGSIWRESGRSFKRVKPAPELLVSVDLH